MLVWPAVRESQTGNLFNVTFPEGSTCKWGGRMQCSSSIHVQLPMGFLLGVVVVYGAMYYVYLARASLQLSRRLYQRFRVLHLVLQLQVRHSYIYSLCKLPDLHSLVCVSGECPCTTLDCLGAISALILLSLFVYITVARLCIQHAFDQLTCGSSVFVLQLRWNAGFMLCFIVSILFLWFVGDGVCASYTVVWLGILPLLLLNTTIIINSLIVTETMLPSDGEIVYESGCHSVAWTIGDLLRMRKEQSEARVKRGEPADLEAEPVTAPVFCVEGAVKCLFWSLVVYDFTEADDRQFTLVRRRRDLHLHDQNLGSTACEICM